MYRGFVFTEDLSEPSKFYGLLSDVSPVGSKTVEVSKSSGRILASDVEARRPSPPFTRSAMDGYAIRAEDAKPGAILKVVGSSRIGEGGPETRVGPGEAVYVDTGAPVPPGANAVIPIEFVEETEDGIEVKEPVEPGDNLDEKGSFVKEGEVIYETGHEVAPVDVAVMIELGVDEVEVREKLKVKVITTGDELVPDPTGMESPYDIPDCIGPALRARLEPEPFVEFLGRELVPDDEKELRETVEEASSEAHVVILTGGSSVGKKDVVKNVLADLYDRFIHGIRFRPGRPFGLAVGEDGVAFTLPGWPTSALTTFETWVFPALKVLAGADPRVTAFKTSDHNVKAKKSVGVVARVRIKNGRAEALPKDVSSNLQLFCETDALFLLPPGAGPGDDGYLIPVRRFEDWSNVIENLEREGR